MYIRVTHMVENQDCSSMICSGTLCPQILHVGHHLVIPADQYWCGGQDGQFSKTTFHSDLRQLKSCSHKSSLASTSSWGFESLMTGIFKVEFKVGIQHSIEKGSKQCVNLIHFLDRENSAIFLSSMQVLSVSLIGFQAWYFLFILPCLNKHVPWRKLSFSLFVTLQSFSWGQFPKATGKLLI